MKTLNIKAVIITDGENYIIHGCNDQTPEQMFASLAPLWPFDPSREMAHCVEIPVKLRELEIEEAKPKSPSNVRELELNDPNFFNY